MKNLELALKALKNGIVIRGERNNYYYEKVYAINEYTVIVDETGLGDWDREEYDNYGYYSIKDYGDTWALSKKELDEYFKYVLLEQYFDGDDTPVNKYIYKIGGKFKIGDIVYGKKYVGKIIEEVDLSSVDQSTIKYKRTYLCDSKTFAYKAKSLRHDKHLSNKFAFDLTKEDLNDEVQYVYKIYKALSNKDYDENSSKEEINHIEVDFIKE